MAQGSSSEVFGRGLKLLDLIAGSRHGLTIDQLAEACGMHRSSIYRYVAPLLERSYIAKTLEGRHVLSVKVLELASLLLERLDIRNIAHPLLIALSEQLDATVHLAHLDGVEVVYLDKVETHRSLPLISRIGGRQPSYCTGLGKALLAFLPPERLAEMTPKIEFIPFTAATIDGPARLAAELMIVRARGYAIDDEEHEVGVSCVAFPIFDLYGEPIAAISATALSREMNGRLDAFVQAVQDMAGGLSRALGFPGEAK